MQLSEDQVAKFEQDGERRGLVLPAAAALPPPSAAAPPSRNRAALASPCLPPLTPPGFLVLEGFASPEEVAQLKARGEELVRRCALGGLEQPRLADVRRLLPLMCACPSAPRLPQVEGFDPEAISVFSTKNQAAKTDSYFLDSASAISFFFEERAFDGEGRLAQPKNRAINKIGHGAPAAGDMPTASCSPVGCRPANHDIAPANHPS